MSLCFSHRNNQFQGKLSTSLGHIGKDADVVSFWAPGQFEPLIVATVFPFSHIPSYTGPWLVRGTDEDTRFEQELGRELHGVDGALQHIFSWTVLQQLLALVVCFPPCRNLWCGKCYREVPNNPFPRLDKNEETNGSGLDIESPETNTRYCCGRNEDHLKGAPFECNLCSFRNMAGRDSVLGDPNDHFTLVAIRRVLIDVMWSREPDTVAENWARSRRDYMTAISHLSLRTESILHVTLATQC
jgi:hypothetical protein